MTNWKGICKNFLSDCLCLDSKKGRDERKVEKVSINDGDSNNLENSEISEVKDNADTKKKISIQEWLNQNYPKQERNEVKLIYINEPTLEGEVDLRDFTYEYSKTKSGVLRYSN